MRFMSLAVLILPLSVTLGGENSASNWREFRNGGSSTSASALPGTWSPEKGITWQKELPGYGQSCPVVFNSRVFLTAVVGPMKDQCAVICLDLKTGEQIWSYELEDNAIDAAEMKAMEESFRKRREGSQALARDPIVYGVAAADGAFIIQTGTRLFCVGGN